MTAGRYNGGNCPSHPVSPVSDAAQELIQSALRLDVPDRVVVANAIFASLEEASDHQSDDVRDAWMNEIRRRVDHIDSGRVETVPSSEAWRMIDGEVEAPN